MQSVEDHSIDLVLTDPPYGTTACKWDTHIDLEKMWIELKRVGKDNCSYVFTASQPFTTDLVNSNRKWFKYEWVWDKHIPRNFINAKIMPMQKHENVLVFCNSKTKYNPQMVKRDKPITGKNYAKKNKDSSYQLNQDGSNQKTYTYTHINPNTIIVGCWETNKGKFHPTQKPISLMEYLINTYTDEGNLVLDPFMGCGTTGVACKNLNRNFIGIELNKEYYDVADNRINNNAC
jgi:site-specific DNA-methyltransferase (adenine-specific)